MKITALVENQSRCELKAKHGLSLYIETEKHKILFDIGPDNTLFENAGKRNISLEDVDTVIISHGHLDHGGALDKFFEINNTAKVYVQEAAFEPHYTKVLGMRFPCGIKAGFRDHPQVVLLNGDYKIDDELSLFTVKDTSECYSFVNDSLYQGKVKDNFEHEHNLVIKEDKTALIMGCGHSGIVNILREGKKYSPDICVGGYHLMNPNSKKAVSESLMDDIAEAMNSYGNIKYYTCHCTGKKPYEYLKKKVKNLSYLSCGESIELK